MNIQFFGDFTDERLAEVRAVARERGHQESTPADVVFLMAYPRNIPLVAEAAKLGKEPKCVLVMRVTQPRVQEERAFFKTRLVTDIVDAPFNVVQTVHMFQALEAVDTSSLR